MTDNDCSVVVYDNRLNPAVFFDAFRDIFNLCLVVLLCVVRIRLIFIAAYDIIILEEALREE